MREIPTERAEMHFPLRVGGKRVGRAGGRSGRACLSARSVSAARLNMEANTQQH
jgi:hypothetical protein